ncbi:MAG TPA: hypothetical protein VGO01_07040 [Bradyrhizobium sp.]|jgi:hypothetical protein|nr:hypothetical protein [Bradyrhizobium sp.]
MRPAVVVLVLCTQLALTGNAALAQDAARSMTLELPRALAASETAFIEVQVGPIGRGRTIEVTTASGEPLGVVSPFGVRTGQDAGTYPLPVPKEAIRDGRLSIRLTISQPGGAARAPTTDEVRAVKLGVGGGTR